MRILICGANGMLAHAVIEKFKDGNELFLTERSASDDRIALDITDKAVVDQVVSEVKPDLLINCAAYTAVDKAEEQEELAYKINAEGPENLALACAKNDCVLVHISTDYVFGGNLDPSKEHLEDDPKSPESAYGRTKLAGEEAIVKNLDKYYIFRTAWLYGDGGKNFVTTMLGVARAQLANGAEAAEVSVVSDQHGSPTYTDDLVDIIYQAVTKQIPYGIYNATNLGNTTWSDFTCEIYKQAGVSGHVTPIDSETYERNSETKAREKAAAEGTAYVKPVIAKRPLNSQMSKAKLIAAGVEIPSWQEALARFLKKENK